jgi:hypothetical protein
MRELALGPRVPGGEDSLEFLRDETTVIDLDGGPGDALGSDGVRQGGESQLVSEEGVSPVSEKPEAFCDAITVSESEGDQVVPRRMEGVDEFGQGFERGRYAGTGTVSESGLEWECSRSVSVRDRLGGARAVAPFKDGIGAPLERSDFE